jgi:hypothetical protein
MDESDKPSFETPASRAPQDEAVAWKRRLHAAGRDVAVHLADAADEDDAVAGRIAQARGAARGFPRRPRCTVLVVARAGRRSRRVKHLVKPDDPTRMLTARQPHRRWLPAELRLSEKAATPLGGLNLVGVLSDEQYEAGRRYQVVVGEYRVSIGIPDVGKSERLAHVMAVINLQKEALAGGLTNLVNAQNLYNSAAEVVKLVDLKNVDQFFTDPKTQTPPQPPPDPKLTRIQTQAALDAQQAQGHLALQERKAAHDAALAEQRFALDRQMALLQHELAARDQAFRHARAGGVRPPATPDASLDVPPIEASALDAGSPPQPPMGPAPPLGAALAADGEHYVPDPARPGKYLRVIPQGPTQ